MAGNTHAVAAKRDIDIIAKPGAERHMPALPKFTNARRNIRIMKVFRKTEAKYFAKPNRHITVSGKIKINVERICHCIKPEEKHRFVIGFTENTAEFTQQVCNQNLLAKPKDKTAYTKRTPLQGMRSALKLIGNIGITHNRPCNQLRKKRNICCKINQIPLCRNLPAVNVNGIAEYLERIKADSNRQSHPKQRNRKPCHFVEVTYQEISIFKISQHGKAARGG